MKRIPVFEILLVLSVLAAASSEALGCRYNVRETGFVDLGIDAYRLFCFVDSEMPAEEISQLESLATEVLTDTSVSFELVSVDQAPDHPALEYRRPIEGRSRPSAALVSRRGNSLWLGPLWNRVFAPDQVRAALQEIVSSPVRSRIAEELATAFAVILLIEGEDQLENSHAQSAVREAIEILESELEYFPKPIQRGPALVTLTREEFASEPLLLWSFHLEADDLELPVAAVLYGRGRWIGPAMIGEEITFDLVSRILFVIGADCECGLDLRLIRGTRIPIPWNRSLQGLVSKELGFDPDNPLVKMEVSQILRINSWLYTQGGAIEPPAETLEDPTPKDSSSTPLSLLLSNRFFYLIGGFVALVLCLGVFILVRAERNKQ